MQRWFVHLLVIVMSCARFYISKTHAHFQLNSSSSSRGRGIWSKWRLPIVVELIRMWRIVKRRKNCGSHQRARRQGEREGERMSSIETGLDLFMDVRAWMFVNNKTTAKSRRRVETRTRRVEIRKKRAAAQWIATQWSELLLPFHWMRLFAPF